MGATEHSPEFCSQADSQTNLIAFHHAGGSTASFVGWQAALGGDLTLAPVRLPSPSRDDRYSFSEMIDALDVQLADVLARPHALLGQSMGALIAYHLACKRALRGMRQPERLVVVGCSPPCELVGALGAHKVRTLLSDEPSHQFGKHIPGFATSVAPAQRLRDHLELLSSYVPDPVPYRLDCPVDVFIGSADHVTSAASAAGWEAYTLQACHVHRIDGGHVFRGRARKDFLWRLRGILTEEPEST